MRSFSLHITDGRWGVGATEGGVSGENKIEKVGNEAGYDEHAQFGGCFRRAQFSGVLRRASLHSHCIYLPVGNKALRGVRHRGGLDAPVNSAKRGNGSSARQGG
jgi:hypothetical protein